MALTPPPKKKLVEDKKASVQEKKIIDVINKGGQPTRQAEPVQDEVKSFNIKLYQSMLKQIDDHRAEYPKPVGQKRPGISINGWILEAIEEKLKRKVK